MLVAFVVMAPRASRWKAKAKAQASAPAKAPSATNLVDKAEEADAISRRASAAKKRTLEEEAENSVRDNFKMCSQAHLRMVLDSKGLSVYDRILDARRRKTERT